MTNKLTLGMAMTALGEMEETIIAKTLDTEEANSVFLLMGIEKPTYIRLSVRAHVALLDEEGNEHYPHKHWFTRKVVEAFNELEPDSEVVKSAIVALEKREAKYIEAKLSADEAEGE